MPRKSLIGVDIAIAPSAADRPSRTRGKRRRVWVRLWRPVRAHGRALVVLAFLGAGGFSLWQSGWVAQTGQRAVDYWVTTTHQAGLRVADVLVEGRQRTDAKVMLDAIGLQRGDPMMAVHPQEICQKLEALPWIKTAVVERRLPDTIFIRVTERTPVALWQYQQQMALIDETGAVLTRENLGIYKNLPILVGAEAPQNAGRLFAELAKVPSVRKRVDAATWVGNRRWDLRLDNQVLIRLPETGIAEALQQVAGLDAKDGLLGKDIVAIDLRVPDRVAVQTSPAAAERRRKPDEKI